MKVSNKIFTKMLFFIPIYFLIAGIVFSTEAKMMIQSSYTENDINNLNTINNAIRMLCGLLFVFFILAHIYIIKTDKLIKQIKKYRDFMLATNVFTIDEISQEFGESAEIIQKNIQIAIDKKILKNVYFSNKDKKIYILDSKSKKPNMNFDYNVNMNIKEENNISIQKDK